MNDRDATAGSAEPVPAESAPDVLPEDLQPALADHEDYIFPNNNRRRIPGYLYLGVALALVVLYLAYRDSPYVNGGYLFAAVLLGGFGAYSIASGWNLDVDEREALVASVARVGFPVGHASAQMGWRGLLSRPTWRILLYSADEPPSKRGFVLVDGVDGEVVEALVEDNPEDWSEFDDEPEQLAGKAGGSDADAEENGADGADRVVEADGADRVVEADGAEPEGPGGSDEPDVTGESADPGLTPGSGTV
ncbi:MAG: hypothetical protein ACK5RL_14610 [Acidimicrobiales bacterium]